MHGTELDVLQEEPASISKWHEMCPDVVYPPVQLVFSIQLYPKGQECHPLVRLLSSHFTVFFSGPALTLFWNKKHIQKFLRPSVVYPFSAVYPEKGWGGSSLSLSENHNLNVVEGFMCPGDLEAVLSVAKDPYFFVLNTEMYHLTWNRETGASHCSQTWWLSRRRSPPKNYIVLPPFGPTTSPKRIRIGIGCCVRWVTGRHCIILI